MRSCKSNIQHSFGSRHWSDRFVGGSVHDMGSFADTFADLTVMTPEAGADAIEAGHAQFGQVIHPIVVVHPVTKRPCLFVNEAFTDYIIGKDANESQRLLGE